MKMKIPFYECFWKRFLSFLALCFVLLMAGCDTGEEPIPAFIHIPSFELEVPDPSEGSASSKITNALVFLRDASSTESPHSLGVLSLPATVPVLLQGEYQLFADPIIKANGNSLYLAGYPFYERFETTVNLSPNEEITVLPVTTYKDSTKFEFIEDFEGNDLLFTDDRDEDPQTFVKKSEEDIFEGSFSGQITLDTAHPLIVVATDDIYAFDASAGNIYMELNYKTDVPIEFGVLAVDAVGTEFPNFEFAVLPKNEWNKIYFDMKDLILTANTPFFIFIFRAAIPKENNQYTLEKANIFLDNIKLVHF